MKKKINQTELEEIEKEIEEYFAYFNVPAPTENKLEETIVHIKHLMVKSKMPSRQNQFSLLWNEMKNVSIQLMILQFIIFCSSIYVFYAFSPRATLGFIFCVAPLSTVLGLTECLKSKTNQVTELEMTYKYGTGQLFLNRFIIGTVIHILTVVPMILLTGSLETEFVTTLIIVWLVPALTVAILFLVLSFYLPQQLTIAPVIIVSWLLGSILLSTQQTALLGWITLPITIHLITVSFLTFCLYKIIVRYQEEFHNGIEYSIN